MSELRLEQFLPYRLNRVAAATSAQLAKTYKRKYALTVPEWRTLVTLAEYGQMTAKDIGAHSAMHKTKVSRAVALLEEKRWLKRTRDDNDRRFEKLELTPQGRKAYAQMEPDMLKAEQKLIETLSAAQCKDMLKGLNLLEKALGIR